MSQQVQDFQKKNLLSAFEYAVKKEKNFQKVFTYLNLTFPEEDIKNFLIHNWYLFYEEKKKTELGAYYTPNEIVEWGFQKLKELLKDLSDYVILDPACGCGSFLFKDWKAKRVIGADLDSVAVEILKTLKFLFDTENIEMFHTNSLKDACRIKFRIKHDEKLVIVGNPPYNDPTSKNKRALKEKKSFKDIDEDLKKRDIGMSFFELCVKLKADAVCFVHPFSYFIKKRNFQQLKNFFDNYSLKMSLVFSSHIFHTRRIPFPLAISVFLRDKKGTSWEELQHFAFPIKNTSLYIVPARVETIDGYIEKYGKKVWESESGLFFFNFRDLNSLIANGAFSIRTNGSDYIPITKDNFYKYAYLNSLKNHWEPKEGFSFVFGNFSPLCRKRDLENKDYQSLFIADAVIHNYLKFSQFDFKDKNSFIVRSRLVEQILNTEAWNLKNLFQKWMETNNKEIAKKICDLVENYFKKLKKEMLV
jgi:hypothetical protein